MAGIRTISAQVHIGIDGLLTLQVPTDLPAGDYEVTVQMRRIVSEEDRQEDWRRFVLESCGSIGDPTFFRHNQGVLEERDEWA